MEDKLKIGFANRREIRMGTPYMMADLRLEGLDFEIPNACWQDKLAVSDDMSFIALISFDLSDNEPGFEIHIIDRIRKTTTKTKRMFGLVMRFALLTEKLRSISFFMTRLIRNQVNCAATLMMN